MTNFYLHYIGARIYSKEMFQSEARKHGIARAIPTRFLHGLEFGSLLLLGQWAPKKSADGEKFDPKDREGIATVFGYSQIQGLNVKASQNARQQFMSRLTVISKVVHNPVLVERGCGSYMVDSTSYVQESMKDILKIAAEIEEQTKEEIRFFVTGPFLPFEMELVLEPAKFTRTILTVSIDDWLPAGMIPSDGAGGNQGIGNALQFIFDYASRKYVKKNDRQRLLGELAKDVVP